jgi:hypothetical protein
VLVVPVRRTIDVRSVRQRVVVAEAAWRWVLDQVQWDDDGPWIPESGSLDGAAAAFPQSEYRDGMHSGLGGLAYVLAELRLRRRWTAEEEALAEAIGVRLHARIATDTVYDFFDGLVSTVGALSALDAEGIGAAVQRLDELMEPDGWPQRVVGPPRYSPDARLNDITLGTASVLLGALWARRRGVVQSESLAERAATLLLGEAEVVPTGLMWRFVPRRFRVETGAEMPNLSHGLAGIATAIALAGAELARPAWIDAARRGAEHLVTLADTTGGGCRVPHLLPDVDSDEDRFAHGWCHGGTGTSLLFLALVHAGVDSVAGVPTLEWHRRCLHAVRTSGLPARLYPGFWDNDGRCCGTAGVGDAFLDSWQREGNLEDVDFANQLADVLVERATIDGPHAYWRFLEHRATEPLLPPGVGWMQGAAGIAAFLLRVHRVSEQGRHAPALPRLDNWWALPQPSSHGRDVIEPACEPA